MLRPYTLYLDETGNRHPDKKSDKSRENRDWFGMGGVLIKGEHLDEVKDRVSAFSARWELAAPLHITDMLSHRKGFSFLGLLSKEDKDRFWREWTTVLCDSPVLGVGCIVDRPGYLARGYLSAYPNPWLLCRSAFDITIERCTKIAMQHGRKLHVVFEQDPGFNRTVTRYFEQLKSKGLGFDEIKSLPFAPLTQQDFARTLGRIDHKPKTHQLLHLADTYIYSMARAAYDKQFRLFQSLSVAGRIADSRLGPHMGVKYFCFDHKNEKTELSPGFVAAPVR